jgi:hypothetical protein
MDYAEFQRRSQRKGAPLYPRGDDRYDFSIFPREPAWTYVSGFNSMDPKQSKSQLYVCTALNGGFAAHDREHMMKLYDIIKPLGLSGTARTFDPRSEKNYKNIGLPVAVHGSDQTVNTGPEKIRKGDHILFTLPDPNNPIPAAIQGFEKRILPWLTPYRPRDPADKNHAFLAQNIMEYIRTRKDIGQNGQDPDRSAVGDGALLMRRAILQAALVVIDTLCDAGLLEPTKYLKGSAKGPEKLSRAEWTVESTKYRADRERTLRNLHDILHIESRNDTFTTYKRYKDITEVPFDELLDLNLFSMTPEHAIFPQHMIKESSESTRSKIYEDQMTIAERMLKSVELVNSHFSDRIIGRAMSDAESGEKFYIMLSHSRIGL